MRQGVEVVRARVARAVGVGSHSVHRQPRTGTISGTATLLLESDWTGGLFCRTACILSGGGQNRAVHGSQCP